MSQKKWIFRPFDSAVAESLQQVARLSPVVSRLLALRGITDPTAAKAFIQPRLSNLRHPHELPGVQVATTFIVDFVKRQQARPPHQAQTIAIYGDYDCDGMTAVAILTRCFNRFNIHVKTFVPNRLDDGYGLNQQALQKLADDGVGLVITVDCGITSQADIEFASKLGLSVIVTDHHQVGDQLPTAEAIVHPGIEDYPFAGLCGAGVALKLAWSLCMAFEGQDRVSTESRNYLMSAVGLAAIGTVADVVPLVDENRLIVHTGLQVLRDCDVEGIRQLLDVTRLSQKPSLKSEDIAFTLAPRLNATGRLGQASLGVELLTSNSRHRIEQLAEYINNLNSSRDSIERKITKSVREQIKDRFHVDQEPAIVVADRSWHRGVIGIVAGRIASQHHRPTIVISMDPHDAAPAVGSCRSAMGIDLYDALRQCGDYLVSFGGHRAAAGLKIMPDKIDAFREAFFEAVSEQANVVEMTPELVIDIEASFVELTLGTLQEIEKVAPFGEANRRPLLCATEVELDGEPKKIGESQRHLSLKIKQNGISLRAVAFGAADWANELESVNAPFDIAFHPVINEFRGMRSVELQLVDWRRADAPEAKSPKPHLANRSLQD